MRGLFQIRFMVSRGNKVRYLTLLCIALVSLPSLLARDVVGFSRADATTYTGETVNLDFTNNVWSSSELGWGSDVKSDKSAVALFTLAEPLEADLIDLSMFFISGSARSSFANFKVSYTTDEQPSLNGDWRDLPLLNFSAVHSKLSEDENGHILASEVKPRVQGVQADEIYQIFSRLPKEPVTGFRLEVFPMLRTLKMGRVKAGELVMAWSISGGFKLTELRLNVVSTSTNVAFAAPVTSTHSLHGPMSGAELTDGWPSTFAHPNDKVRANKFYFEIDLGQQRIIDHINLRQRGDNHSLGRFGKMRVELFDRDPHTGAEPIWEIFHRSDGSYPKLGEVDVIDAEDGEGTFRGRYIRISSENLLRGSPQLAEIEVYETRKLKLLSVIVDGQPFPIDSQLQIPPGVDHLGFQFEIPQIGMPYDRLYRWRITNSNKGWQISNSLLLEIPCPPGGDYGLELQAAHSDGTWDASVYKIPFSVDVKFSETIMFLWLIVCLALFCGIICSRYLARRKIRRLARQSELEMERSRIAANMHDDVGARLAQLAVLHDVFVLKHGGESSSDTSRNDSANLAAYAREAMDALDEAVWTVNPRNDKLQALAIFLMHYADSYLLPLDITCSYVKPDEWPDIQISSSARHEVVLAFKEALQNIVKHAEATEVEVTFNIQPKVFMMTVSDNGLGFSPEPIKIGNNGLVNMRQRLESIEGTCTWSSIKNVGTNVKMQFPLL